MLLVFINFKELWAFKGFSSILSSSLVSVYDDGFIEPPGKCAVGDGWGLDELDVRGFGWVEL